MPLASMAGTAGPCPVNRTHRGPPPDLRAARTASSRTAPRPRSARRMATANGVAVRNRPRAIRGAAAAGRTPRQPRKQTPAGTGVAQTRANSAPSAAPIRLRTPSVRPTDGGKVHSRATARWPAGGRARRQRSGSWTKAIPSVRPTAGSVRARPTLAHPAAPSAGTIAARAGPAPAVTIRSATPTTARRAASRSRLRPRPILDHPAAPSEGITAARAGPARAGMTRSATPTTARRVASRSRLHPRPILDHPAAPSEGITVARAGPARAGMTRSATRTTVLPAAVRPPASPQDVLHRRAACKRTTAVIRSGVVIVANRKAARDGASGGSRTAVEDGTGAGIPTHAVGTPAAATPAVGTPAVAIPAVAIPVAATFAVKSPGSVVGEAQS